MVRSYHSIAPAPDAFAGDDDGDDYEDLHPANLLDLVWAAPDGSLLAVDVVAPSPLVKDAARVAAAAAQDAAPSMRAQRATHIRYPSSAATAFAVGQGAASGRRHAIEPVASRPSLPRARAAPAPLHASLPSGPPWPRSLRRASAFSSTPLPHQVVQRAPATGRSARLHLHFLPKGTPELNYLHA